MDNWEHLTEYRLRETEMAARAEQVRVARERLAAQRPAAPSLVTTRRRWQRALDTLLHPTAPQRTA